MSQFDLGLPSVRQVQDLIKDQQEVELKLITNDLLVGRLIWQDSNCVCLSTPNNPSILIWRQALIYVKPVLS